MELNYKQIAEDAYGFYNVGQLWISSPNKWPVGPLRVPFYVDTAFACGLYMKAIIVRNNPSISKKERRDMNHGLNTLFCKLPGIIQNQIVASIPDSKVQEKESEKIANCKAQMEYEQAAETKMLYKNMIDSATSTFMEILIKHAQVFIKWRYYYETTNNSSLECDEWFLYEFCQALHNIVADIMNGHKM